MFMVCERKREEDNYRFDSFQGIDYLISPRNPTKNYVIKLKKTPKKENEENKYRQTH